MSKKIYLSIPEPCHEDWNKMNPVEQGRFCNSCQKQVTDFTGMSDQQLIAFFKKPSTGSVCGRFIADQLQRDIDIPRKRVPWIKYFFQFAIPAFLVSTKVVAQGKVIMRTGFTVITQNTSTKTVEKLSTVIDKKQIITGRVVDDKGEGIPYTSVFVKGTNTGTASDSAGYFVLIIPVNKSIVLVSSCVGYESMEKVIDVTTLQESLTISMKTMNTLDEVVVVAGNTIRCSRTATLGEVFISRKVTLLDTVFNKITSVMQLPPKVYPNPVKKNNLLTIDIGKHKPGSHSFQFFSITGQLISTKEIWMDDNMRSIQIEVPVVTAGTYFLKIINKATGKFTSEKIIVE